jgi:hypothetical protein
VNPTSNSTTITTASPFQPCFQYANSNPSWQNPIQILNLTVSKPSLQFIASTPQSQFQFNSPQQSSPALTVSNYFGHPSINPFPEAP